MNRALRKRIDSAEAAVTVLLRCSPECICFPPNEGVCWHWPVEREIAARVKCTVHGERFSPVPFFHVYVSGWLKKKRGAFLASRSAKFRKAWDTTFPQELWPAEEIKIGGKDFLKLKDGSILSTDSLQDSSIQNLMAAWLVRCGIIQVRGYVDGRNATSCTQEKIDL